MDLGEDIFAEYEAVVHDAQTLTFLARASELQEEAIETIERFVPRLAACKTACVQASDESGANSILWRELALKGVRAELLMWQKLKRETPEEAWDELVGAQSFIEAAARVRRQLGEDSKYLDNLHSKLILVEHVFFPSQMFNSIGGLARRECSICGCDYADCKHVVQRAYMGQICHTIIKDLQVHEISIVENPSNKGCRLTHFSDDGMMRNRMTWRLEDRPQPSPGMPANGHVVRFVQPLDSTDT